MRLSYFAAEAPNIALSWAKTVDFAHVMPMLAHDPKKLMDFLDKIMRQINVLGTVE